MNAIDRKQPGSHGKMPRFASRATWLAIRTLALALIIAAVPVARGMAAPQAQDMVLSITYPTEGSTVSGEVTVMGTATHPNFVSYGVLYATGARVTGDTAWKLDTPIAWDVRSMVVNGALGVWDTTQVPNGQYVLALVVYEVGNETPNVHFVNNLTVLNEEATPTPEPTATPESGEPGVDPTLEAGEPPEAPTIEQPPTATPRPTPTLAPESGAAGGEDDGDDGGSLLPSDILSIDAIKEAFGLGAQLAFLLYAVGILYVLAKAVIRYYLRQSRQKPSP
jgi:hypothetical protein